MGANVGVEEGAAVGDTVGKGVGLPGKYVGESVGVPDGDTVGDEVGKGVGSATAEAVDVA